MKYIISALLTFIVGTSTLHAQVSLSGFVREMTSQESLPGAIVKVRDSEQFVVANEYGFYSMTLPAGTYAIDVYFPGYDATSFTLTLTNDATYDFELLLSNSLKEVNIVAKKSVADEVRMGTHQLSVSDIQAVPAILGEKDVFKIIKLLPGVQKGQEGSSGFNVRGGGTDQNLIILDDAVVYNASHLFGFFSTFNGDALKGVELIKGGFPARYGERLSSVLNLTMREGNKDHFTGEYGVGILSSRLTLEGPIAKDKSSFLLSGRRTYFDIFLQPFLQAFEDVRAGYYFYDFNTKFNYQLNDRNSVYLSGYFGRDKFYARDADFSSSREASKNKFGWGNATGTLRWNHIFHPKLFANLTINYSNYNMAVEMEEKWNNQHYKTKLISAIDDMGGKYDLSYYWHADNTLRVGYKLTRHLFRPNATTLVNNGIEDTSMAGANRYISWEHNIYVDDEWKVNNRLSLHLGARASAFSTRGKTYFNIEPRGTARLLLNDLTSIKASYTIMNQYMHLLSSTGINLPTDLWVPATDRVAPQRAYQYSMGIFRDLLSPNLSMSLEAYYKTMDHIITYKEGASFMDIEDPLDPSPTNESTYEDKVTSGKGYSYGVEIMVQKPKGRVNGWVSYTWSKTRFQFEEVNNGDWFYARYDRRHDLNIVGFYELSPRIKINGLFTFATGNPLSLPQYSSNLTAVPPSNGNLLNPQYNTSYTTLYSQRNDFRVEPYHRMDVGIQFIKERKKGTRIWEISIYNVYNRKNPFYYAIDTNRLTGEEGLYKYTVFTFIPSISYTHKFR